MDCKEFEKKIPAFIDNSLEYKELKQFMEHFENCSECKEELTIQVLVQEGLSRLEEGNAFDLQEELMRRMQEAEGRIRMRNSLKYLRVTLEIIALAALAVIIAFFAL